MILLYLNPTLPKVLIVFFVVVALVEYVYPYTCFMYLDAYSYISFVVSIL